jgi:hypothetical protein
LSLDVPMHSNSVARTMSTTHTKSEFKLVFCSSNVRLDDGLDH